VGQGGAAGVDQKDVFPKFEAFEVRMAADHDVRLRPGKAAVPNCEVLSLEVVDHRDAPAVDVEDLHFLDPGVDNSEVVVPSRGEDGRDFLQPIKHNWVNNVSGMEDKIDTSERLARLLPEGRAFRGLVGVRDQSNQHVSAEYRATQANGGFRAPWQARRWASGQAATTASLI
jgi:hypothetical protein